MKYHLKVNKSIRYAGFVLLILMITFASLGAASTVNTKQKSASQAAIVKYAAAQRNPAVTDEEKIKVAIDAYFTTRYEGQKLLAAQDFSTLIEDNTLDWVKKEKDRRDVEIYMATLTGLKYQSYKFTLDYDSIEIKGNKAVVSLRENNEVVFESLAPEVSQLANLHHTFILHNKKGAWMIYQEEYQDEFSKAFTENSKNQLIEQINKKYQENKKSISPNNNMPTTPLTVNYSYNRSAAKFYSYTYRSYATKNTAYKSMYSQDGYGGDCTNFVSQILYAGAPQMSTGWMYNNKGTSTTDDDTWTLSWSVVPNLASFLTTNSGVGPYGSVIPTVYNGIGLDTADVVQVSSDGGVSYFHTVAAYQYVTNQWTIVGHDTDRFNYPIDNYFLLYTLRFIKINGWRS